MPIDFSTGYQLRSLRLAPSNFSPKLGGKYIEKGNIVFSEKSHLFLLWFHFLEHETYGIGRDFFFNVPKGLPSYLLLAQSFDFWRQNFELFIKRILDENMARKSVT